MIGSFITGSVSRFLLRFLPSLLDLYSSHMKHKHEMEMMKFQSGTQITLKELESDAPLKMAELETLKPKTKIEWVLAFNDLMRPLVTIFWTIVYPTALIYMIKSALVMTDPFYVLSQFSEDTIGLILGFWFTDGIVKKRK